MIYRLYPTLLNSFNLYVSQSRDGNGKIIVDEIELIDRINRVRKPTTNAQQKGIDFEILEASSAFGGRMKINNDFEEIRTPTIGSANPYSTD